MKRILSTVFVFGIFGLLLILISASRTSSASDAENQVTNAGYSTELKDNLEYEPNSVLALNYHRVRDMTAMDDLLSTISNSKELSTYSVSTEEFDRQMSWLVEHDAEFLTVNEVIKYYEQGEFPPRSVWINFDDMDQTVYENAHPILEKYNIPATGYVITGQAGNPNFSNLDLIDKEGLKEMADSGVWEFGTHTHDMHYMNSNDESMLIKRNEQEVHNDLKASQEYLQENFDTDNTTIGYPYGQANDTTTKVMEDLGIDYGFTLEENVITPDSNPHYMPRILVSEDSFKRLVETWEGFE